MKNVRLLGIVCALSVLAVISMACAADEPSAPTAPQAPAPAAPAAPAQAGSAVAPGAPQQPAAPQQAAQAAPAITAVPVAPQVQKLAPPTPVPTPAMMATSDWVAEYVSSAGYKPEWGEPVYGGILRYGANLKLNGHDPNYGHTYEGPQFLPTYNSLIKFDPWQGLTGPILPDLAETWDISGDGTVVTFKLREGIKFQDNPHSTLPEEVLALVAGDEFTCEDAAASLQFAIYPPQSLKDVGVTHAGPRLGLSHLKDGGATCPDGPMGYTLRAEFEEARAGTIGKFAGVTGMPNNMDKDLIAWWSAECPDCWDQTTDETYLYGTGTGAFIPVDRVQDVGTKIRANPDYWREGLPFLEGVDHIEIEDSTTRFTALITGQTDYYGEGSASLLPGQVGQVLERYADDIHLEPVLHLWGKGLQINLHREPWNDERVRYAVHLGIDRDDWVEINRIEGGGQNVIGVLRPTNWMPPGTVWALPDDELWAMPGFRNGPGEKQADIDEANRLLDEAGLTGSPRFTAGCMTTAVQIFIDGCLYFKDQLKKNLDIELNVDVVETAVQRQRGQTAHGEPPDYDVHYGSKARTDVADPSDFYNLFFVPETESWYHRGTGRFQEDPERAQKLLDLSLQQAVELDPAKRREIVHEIERISIDAAYMIPMPWSIIWPAWHKDVRGWRMFNHPSQIKWSGWERAWLAR